jgi:hypothetical protein
LITGSGQTDVVIITFQGSLLGWHSAHTYRSVCWEPLSEVRLSLYLVPKWRNELQGTGWWWSKISTKTAGTQKANMTHCVWDLHRPGHKPRFEGWGGLESILG